MKANDNRRRKPALLALLPAVAAVALACLFALPASALADERVGHSVDASGTETSYGTVADALKASYTGVTVVMDADWHFEYQKNLDAPEGSKVAIDMNGHRIVSDGVAIYLRKDAQITLKSSTKAAFEYDGYDGTSGSKIKCKTTSGGLITTTKECSAIKGAGFNTVILDGVTVGGCNVPSTYLHYVGNGAVNLANSTLTMRNGASIEHNKSYEGGGVHLAGLSATATLNMDNASISNNYAETGGGVYLGTGKVAVNMKNGAKIEHNSAKNGGGIDIFADEYAIKSEDGNAFISDNVARGNGGGVQPENCGEMKGKVIEGITISNNTANNGGGIYLYDENLVLKKCVITGNTSKCDGGGVYVNKVNGTLENCTVTGNACDLEGKNNEGGGVFVSYDVDISVSGLCKIEGNTRGKGSANKDDVFLSTDVVSNTTMAYIKGNLSQGSNVGVRTSDTYERRIAKNFSYEIKGVLFMDLDGYYVSYGTDEGGDAWQRYGTADFILAVDGQSSTHKSGSAVAISVPVEKNGTTFWYWDTAAATGLDPVSKYITNKYNPALAFRMPSSNASIKSVYATRTKSAAIQVEAPEAGKALPPTAKITYNDGTAKGSTATVSVNWYEVSGNKKTQATGNAKANATYVALFTASQDTEHGVFFDGGISAGSVTVSAGSAAVKVASTKVNAATGTLAVVSDEYKTAGASTPADTKTGTVKVKVEKKGVVEGGAKAAAAVAALSDDERESAGAAGGEDTLFEISYAYSNDSDQVTIAAPYLEGYNFLAWGGVGKGLVDDDVVTISVSELAEIENTLTATYTPVVTGLTVDLDAPVAGEALAAACGGVKAACSGDEEFDFATVLGKEGGFAVIWSPEDPDDAGAAAYSTAYTALIELDEVDDLENVEDVLADGAEVTCNGVTATSAGFVAVDGKLYLAVAFPATADKAAEPDDDKKDDSDKGDDQKDDDSGKSDDKKDDGQGSGNQNSGNQGSDNQNNGASQNSGNQNNSGNKANASQASAKSKKGVPATGDAASVAAPAALLAASAAFLAGARVSRRRR